jgi:SAM-dependent methyltransferase
MVRYRKFLRDTLERLGLLGPAKTTVAVLLGNKRFRRYCTSNFASGKIAFGEKNQYVLPMFPLDWIRVDIDGADFNLNLSLCPSFPFPDNSQQMLYAAHLVEHLAQESFEHFLKECHRVLGPGGAIRIETPDAELLIEAYRRRDERVLRHFRAIRQQSLVERLGFSEKYLEDHLTVLGELSNYIDHRVNSGHIPAYAPKEQFEEKLATLDLDSFSRWCVSLQSEAQLASGGHKNWMTWDKIRRDLLEAGFGRVVQVGFGKTAIPGLKLNGGAGSIREKPHRAFYSLFVEAFKGETFLERPRPCGR